jgi:hypothetical protein
LSRSMPVCAQREGTPAGVEEGRRGVFFVPARRRRTEERQTAHGLNRGLMSQHTCARVRHRRRAALLLTLPVRDAQARTRRRRSECTQATTRRRPCQHAGGSRRPWHVYAARTPAVAGLGRRRCAGRQLWDRSCACGVQLAGLRRSWVRCGLVCCSAAVAAATLTPCASPPAQAGFRVERQAWPTSTTRAFASEARQRRFAALTCAGANARLTRLDTLAAVAAGAQPRRLPAYTARAHPQLCHHRARCVRRLGSAACLCCAHQRLTVPPLLLPPNAALTS